MDKRNRYRLQTIAASGQTVSALLKFMQAGKEVA